MDFILGANSSLVLGAILERAVGLHLGLARNNISWLVIDLCREHRSEVEGSIDIGMVYLSTLMVIGDNNVK